MAKRELSNGRRFSRSYGLTHLLRPICAIVLLATGLIHAAQPYLFVYSIANYRLTTPLVSGVLGLWLPYFQITLGFCIGMRLFERTAIICATVLFGVFAIVQTAAFARGLNIDCGCFGYSESRIGLVTIFRPVAVTFCLVYLLYATRANQRRA